MNLAVRLVSRRGVALAIGVGVGETSPVGTLLRLVHPVIRSEDMDRPANRQTHTDLADIKRRLTGSFTCPAPMSEERLYYVKPATNSRADQEPCCSRVQQSTWPLFPFLQRGVTDPVDCASLATR
jgi:hypothetical protein